MPATWRAPKEQKHYGVYYEDYGLTPELNGYAGNETYRQLIGIEQSICVKLEELMFEVVKADKRLDAAEVASLEPSHVKAKRSLAVGRRRGVTLTYKRKGDEKPRQKSEVNLQCLDYHFPALSELLLEWREELVRIARHVRCAAQQPIAMMRVPALLERYPLFDIESAIGDAERFKESYMQGRYRADAPEWMWAVTQDATRADIALFAMELGLQYSLNGVQISKLRDGLFGVLTERIEMQVERSGNRQKKL